MSGEMDLFLEAVNKMAESVYQFHERFEIPSLDISDTDATLEALRQRLALLAEETGEHARALNRADIPDACKEAADVAYIALGTLLRLGVAGWQAANQVSGKNNLKTPETHGKRSSTGKVLSK